MFIVRYGGTIMKTSDMTSLLFDLNKSEIVLDLQEKIFNQGSDSHA